RDQLGEAERLLSRAVAIGERVLPAGHPITARFRANCASCLCRSGRYDEAEPLLLCAYEDAQAAHGRDHPWTHDALREVVGLYEAWGRPDQASQWRAKLPSGNGGSRDGPS
ncbi:MAG: tetratricopeptide repeat protein, partial [bacterium]|nr:tetratricopeptide repeat protein [bacterium]